MTARWQAINPGQIAPTLQTRVGYTTLWLIVFAVNLIVPLLFGFSFAKGTGILGMILGILVCCGLGLALCILTENWRRALIAGAYFTAATQIIPLLHVVAGSVALNTWTRVSGQSNDKLSTVVAGFAVTLFTGQLLMITAIVIGWPVIWIKDVIHGPNTTESSNTDSDAATYD